MLDAAFTQAIAYLRSGDPAAAQHVLLPLSIVSAQRDFLLGACAHALNDIPQAIHHFTQALKQEPNHAQAACALGSLYAGLGHRQAAEQLFRQTLQQVEDTQLRFNLAVVLEDSNRFTEALAEYTEILRQQPSHYAARHNRAGVLSRQKKLAEAAADYRILVREHPQQTLPWHNLGELELALGHYEEAIRLLSEALNRHPENGKALLSLAVAQAANADIIESRHSFQRLKGVAPSLWDEALQRLNSTRGNDTTIDPRIIFLVRMRDHLAVCHWRHWESYTTLFSDLVAHPSGADSLALAFSAMLAPLSALAQRTLMQHIAQQVNQHITPLPLASPVISTAGLRIAYVAPQWGNHVTGLLFREVVKAHSPDVTVFLVNLLTPDNSQSLNALRHHPKVQFVDVSHLDDQAAAQAIRALNVDIAVDLAVYNDNNRPAVLAYRPAPIQVNWQAAPYSSGAPWLDYVISDAIVRPGEGWCSEAEVLMPSCYFTFSHEPMPPSTPERSALGLPERKFVFACLNNPSKINPALFQRWMQLLKNAADSVLWLLANDTAGIMNLKREAEWAGVDPRRLLFAARVSPDEHVARMGAADLFLDTDICNGHTTVAESLWAGTPVITQKGQTFASRVGASLLHGVGLPELVVDTPEAYDALALSLYQHNDQLTAIRSKLASARLQAAFIDIQGQIQQIEKAFWHMKTRHQQGLEPAAFSIADLS